MINTGLLEQELARLPKRRLTVEEFHRLGEAGILDEDDRVELIEGELIQMAPIGSLHAGTVDHLAEIFRRISGAIVRVQNPLVLPALSEPIPDLMLVRPRDDFYVDAHPGPGDVLLLVEVSDSTLESDRDVKVVLYAKHRIPETWLLDVRARQLEVYLRPSDNGYQQVLRPSADDIVTPSLIPTESFRVGDLFVR